ncbi:MAG: DegT/DnrJ/EryC1/StrS family aminotransferase, partial [Sphingobacteriia bacterium]
MYKIWLSPPDVGAAEQALLNAAFETGWIAPAGPYLGQFEQKLCALTGARHAAALSSATAH